MAELKKSGKSLEEENGRLKKRNNELQDELTQLKRQKGDLERDIEELKKRATDAAQAGRSSQADIDATRERQVQEMVPKPLEGLDPCEAVLAFMKKSEAIVREHKGEQRTKLLEAVKQEYAPRMKGAPEKAVKSAEAWVNEVNRSWDKLHDNSVFSLINKRNEVIKACGKKPGEAGF